MVATNLDQKKALFQAFFEDALRVYHSFSGVYAHLPRDAETRNAMTWSIYNVFDRQQRPYVEAVLDLAFNGEAPEFMHAPENVGWLFVHPVVFNALPWIYQLAYGTDVAIVHHVPKTGGTAVTEFLISRMGASVTYYAYGEKRMLQDLGVLPVPRWAFERSGYPSAAPILVSGHLELAGYLSAYPMAAKARILSLFLEPRRLYSSLFRYWIGDIVYNSGAIYFKAYHQHEAEIREVMAYPDRKDQVRALWSIFIKSREFHRLHTENLISRYYFSDQAGRDELKRLFELENIILSEGVDTSAIGTFLGEDAKQIDVPHANVSHLSHNEFSAIVGPDEMESVINGLSDVKSGIYEFLQAAKARHAEV